MLKTCLNKSVYIILFSGIFCIFFLNLKTLNKYPPIVYIKNPASNIVETVFALSMGMREVYSDILYIRLLQYYGTKQKGQGVLFDYAGGNYPLFYRQALDIVNVNPYYTNAVLYSVMCLAFGLEETKKAISLLKIALLYDPYNTRYLKILTAVMVKELKNNNYDKEMLDYLYNVGMMDDTPVLLKQTAAFLNKKAGNYVKAYNLYKKILVTTKDEFYIENAKKQIKILERYIK